MGRVNGVGAVAGAAGSAVDGLQEISAIRSSFPDGAGVADRRGAGGRCGIFLGLASGAVDDLGRLGNIKAPARAARAKSTRLCLILLFELRQYRKIFQR